MAGNLDVAAPFRVHMEAQAKACGNKKSTDISIWVEYLVHVIFIYVVGAHGRRCRVIFPARVPLR